MNSQLALEMQGICKQFPGVKALDNVSFQLRPEETHAIMGANGAGKSTLMKILGGVYHADAGRILLSGKEVKIKSPSMAQHLGISIVFQELNLIPHLSVLENIFLGREIIKGKLIYDWKKMAEEVREILENYEIDINLHKTVSDLPIAKQQMVEIAKAISRKANIIVFDEPTSSLSIKETDILYRLIDKLKEQKKSIVYISHRMKEIFEVSDRLTLLRDGTFIFCDEIKNITHDFLVDSIVGRKVSKSETRYVRVRQESPQKILEVNSFNANGLFHDISFSLKSGEVLGFAGLVGARRTEVAKAIFGEIGSDSGDIRVNGKVYKPKTSKHAIKRGLAYATEDRKVEGLLLGRPIRENFTLASLEQFTRAGLINKKKEIRTGAKMIGDLAIKVASQEQNAGNLSGGNQQKVSLAKWIMTEPRILILDEPTRGVDVGAKAEFYVIINTLAESGVGIVLISSENDELLLLCDRILVFREGEIVGEVSPNEHHSEKEIMRLMLGAKYEHEHANNYKNEGAHQSESVKQ
jgi:ribose transport system ATP-binding protein